MAVSIPCPGTPMVRNPISSWATVCRATQSSDALDKSLLQSAQNRTVKCNNSADYRPHGTAHAERRQREGDWSHPLNNLVLQCEQLTIKTPSRAKWGPSYPGTTHNPSGPFSGPCRQKQTWRREQHSSQGAFLEPAEEPLFLIFFF